MTVEDGSALRLAAPVDIYPFDASAPILYDGKPYRGSLRVAVNPRGLVNVVNRVDLEQYLAGVVPVEMGPKRYDEIEALKAQAVAARTYALAHRGQFESEGYDLCATPKCQVYSGLSVEDPLSSAALEATKGLVLASAGRLADALFISTCGGRTENVENVFGEPALPYLVSVECGELATSSLPGAAVDRKTVPRPRTGLEWRSYVLAQHARSRKAGRAEWLATAQRWAGLDPRGHPGSLAPAAVYPLSSPGSPGFRRRHLLPASAATCGVAGPGRLAGPARDARLPPPVPFRSGEALPPADRRSGGGARGLLFGGAAAGRRDGGLRTVSGGRHPTSG